MASESFISRLGFFLLALVLLARLSLGSQTILNLDNEVSIENDILTAAREANTMKSCRSCQAMLIPLKRLATIGDGSFVSSMTRICKVRKLQDPDICEGDIGAQGPIIAHALRKISVNGRTSRLFCNALFGMCDLEPVEPYDIVFPDSNTNSRPTGAKVVSSNRKPIQVVHLSDVHIDREYLIGSEANCTKYICCRDFSSKDSETDNEVKHPAEPFGNKHCDSPIRLANSMLHAINELVPNARFTISTGDVVDRANWLLSQEIVEGELHGFHEQLFANLSKSNTFYGSIGNHDGYPTNEFPRSTSDESDGSKWVFDLLSSDWTRWIGDAGASSVQHTSGSYAVVHPDTNLKLISINTQYWYKYNFWLYDSDEFQPDPNGLLAFLVSELDAAEKAGQHAWIFGHIPPGGSDVMRDQSNYYNQVVHRYHKTIAAQFFGHTHVDQFQIAYTNYSDQRADTAMSFGLVAPSLTPTNGNPAFTVYDVDPDTYDIMDAKVYIANMSKPFYHNTPKWELYYSARDTYGPLVASVPSESEDKSLQESYPTSAPLDAAFWHRLTEVFESDNATFAKYMERMVRGAWPRRCSEKCRNVTICDIRAMRAEDNCFHQSLNEIVIPPPGRHINSPYELSDQQATDVDAHGACEGSAIPLIMRRLVSWANLDSQK
ncbi:sphingomyelin phosphodiesterase [Fomitiporia mediterranea MF3/22]|uniref:sphingomyelin phosphodiesterase n=1 Tax=Fomitiporia mediterranea (strain MF3/22) TaxID=694068 RepID=UPI0004407BD0|nr:sphingomyelin phosphodiesterase [Fomitiporia mediterranea MF3/22]EJC99307.1 sphingomyelin phosphodiesterase [Fomitiporia mediterranea MF3/22]